MIRGRDRRAYPNLWDTVERGEAEITRLKSINTDLLEAISAIVEFCDDPNGSDKPESLAMGLARLLPAARTSIAKATGAA